MKFRIIPLVILLLVSFTGCSEPNNKTTESESNTNVNSEIDKNTDTVLVYLKTQDAYDDFFYAGGILSDGNEFVYNDEGQLDKFVDWGMSKPDETEYEYIYEYYENGEIKLSQRYENMNGPYAIEQELKFDENGYIYEQIGYSGGINGRAPDYNFYTYDEDGNMIKDEHYYDLDEIDSVKTYKYGSNGKLVESTYTQYRNLTRHSVFYYNDFGYPSVEIEYDLEMNLECIYLYFYEYDPVNFPLKVTVYKEENPTKIEKIINSAQFPLINVRYNKEDALYVKVFKYEYLTFTKQQEKILLAKKKANIDISVWGYSFDRDF